MERDRSETVCIPEKDIIFIYNADNQGKETSRGLVLDKFFELIADCASRDALPQNKAAEKMLEERTADLKLAYARSAWKQQDAEQMHSGYADLVNGITYIMDPNPMGITQIKFHFQENTGIMEYTNAQGEKSLEFGFGHNVFGLFPQEGYSDQVGSVPASGHFYKCAASGAWVEPSKLFLKIQIIDTYFGNLSMVFGFREKQVGVYMCKCAEDFLDEYVGFAGSTA